MKKSILLLSLLLLILSGCSSNIPKVEDYDWIMASVQSISADGQVIAYGEPENSTLDSIKQIELACEAENGNLTLTDQTNGKIYTGTYQLSKMSKQSSIYEVVVNGKEGMAVVAMTTYQNGSQKPTFIISLCDYAINFFAK